MPTALNKTLETFCCCCWFCLCVLTHVSLSFCRDLKIENFLLDEHNNIKIVGVLTLKLILIPKL